MLIAEYKNFKIYSERDDQMYLLSINAPDGTLWYRHLVASQEQGLLRAYQLIDSEAGYDIITSMNVTKPHTLQVGDVVTIRTTTDRKVILGIVESIQDDWYNVSHVVQKDFYRKTTTVPYQLEKLTLYPNRERWVQIKRDLDRQLDGCILQEWIENK